MLFNSKQKIGVFLACLTAGVTLNMPVALANELDFRLHNHTRSNIQQVYIADSRSRSWGKDVLGTDILIPGEDTNIYFSGPVTWCFFDIKVVFPNGNITENHNINLCEITDYYLNVSP